MRSQYFISNLFAFLAVLVLGTGCFFKDNPSESPIEIWTSTNSSLDELVKAASNLVFEKTSRSEIEAVLGESSRRSRSAYPSVNWDLDYNFVNAGRKQ